MWTIFTAIRWILNINSREFKYTKYIALKKHLEFQSEYSIVVEIINVPKSL